MNTSGWNRTTCMTSSDKYIPESIQENVMKESTTTASVSTMSIPLGKDGKKAANISNDEEVKKPRSFKKFWHEIKLNESIGNYDIVEVVTQNDDPGISLKGTRKIGTIQESYDHLVKLFGEPEKNDDEDEAWRVQWRIEFHLREKGEEDPDVVDDIVVVSIYDWLMKDRPVEDVKEWNVGGHQFSDFDVLLSYLDKE